MKWLALILAFVLCGTASAHEISFSHVDVRIGRDRIALAVQLPIKALLHEQPSALPVGATDQTLRQSLSAAARQALGKLLAARLRLASAGRDLPLTIGTIEPAGDDIALTASAPPPDGPLAVRADLFPGDTLHKIFVNVYRGDALAGQYALDGQDPGFTLDTPERPLAEIVASFVREGIHHIFIGPDHILFVIALVLLGGTLASQVKTITAFTVAHSITLALAALDVVQLPSRLVESAIALSIVIVGLHDLRRLRAGAGHAGHDPRVLFAFAFGLAHGFGFASVLTELELPRRALVWSLAAFNIGVEIGQLAIVLLAVPLLAALARFAPPRIARATLTAVAAAVVLMGSFWLWQRARGA